MFDKLAIMRIAQAMMTHAATRQSVIAQNIANADTPRFRAQDIGSFADTFSLSNRPALRTTRQGHVGADLGSRPLSIFRSKDAGTMSPNGNSVSLENEMLKSIEVRHQHETAIAIYKSSLNILRTSISGR